MKLILVILFLPLMSFSSTILYNVPLARQSTNYSCGAASLQSVLAYYGYEMEEREIMKAVGTEPEFGTKISRMADFANTLGIKAKVKTKLGLEDLQESLRNLHPVIVEAQAWPENSTQVINYKDIWTEGHYLVVIGMDLENVYFVDPVLWGSRGYIPVAAFLDRWHDISESGEKWQHTAILFEGKIAPHSPWKKIP